MRCDLCDKTEKSNFMRIVIGNGFLIKRFLTLIGGSTVDSPARCTLATRPSLEPGDQSMYIRTNLKGLLWYAKGLHVT